MSIRLTVFLTLHILAGKRTEVRSLSFGKNFVPLRMLGGIESMKAHVWAILLLGVVGVVGCEPVGIGPGVQDFVVKIAGDYSIQRSSGHQIQIAPDSWNDSTPIIPTKVIECNTDGHYVIAKRQGLKRRSPNNPSDTYELPDPQVFDYWILDSRTPRVYGPLTLEQFAAKRTELGVAPSLRLKDVYSFRP